MKGRDGDNDMSDDDSNNDERGGRRRRRKRKRRIIRVNDPETSSPPLIRAPRARII